MKITYAQIRHPKFNPLISRIVAGHIPFEHVPGTLKLLDAVQKAQAVSDIGWKAIADKNMELSDPTNPNSELQVKKNYTLKEAHRVNQLVAKFLSTEVEIPLAPISAEVFDYLRFTIEDAVFLEGLFA